MTDRAMKDFFEACGSDGPLIMGVEEPGASGVSWRVLDRPFAVVGRDPNADLYLNDSAVSRRHAYFQMIAGRLFCVDLQSGRGTSWGSETGLWGWVRSDPGVRIGSFCLRSKVDPAGTPLAERGDTLPVPVSRSFEQPSLPETSLEILGQTGGPSVWRVSRSLVLIGRSEACKVRLQGTGVAKVHASLLRTPSGVFVVDLLGPGGILLNGKQVRCARLGRDDELTVGTHKIRVRCAAPAGGPPHLARGSTSLVKTVALSAVPTRVSGITSGDKQALLGDREDTHALVRLMLDEFSQIQGKTAERFQGTLMAVLQSFAGIHQEQMTLIREELSYIRHLTEEQQVLRTRIDRGARVADGPLALRLVSGEPTINASDLPQGVVPSTKPNSPPRRLAIKDDAGHVTSPIERSCPRLPEEKDEGEFHTRIFDRLAEIQGERQGRWQRIMESMLGRGT